MSWRARRGGDSQLRWRHSSTCLVARTASIPSADAQELGRLLLAVMQGIEFLAKTDMDGSALLQIGQAALKQLSRH